MNSIWITFTVLILWISAWESDAITNKQRPLLARGKIRNFRHVAGYSENANDDWERGLREAVNQALLRERYHDYNLRDRLFEAPLIGRRDVATLFGDIVILARGQLYVLQDGSFLFVQDQHQNDCEACRDTNRCHRPHCQIWQPTGNEYLVALWTVKRLRHHNHNDGYHYELEYTVSPITPAIGDFVTRNGNFDYNIPGHIFVVRNDKLSSPHHHQPNYVNDDKSPRAHFKPEILIGVTPDGEKHILHSYPGFYTSFPVHPTYRQKGYSTNDPKEIELYKELIESLASKTSTTQKGPHKFTLNGYTETRSNEIASTKPTSHDPFSTTRTTMVELPTGQLIPLTKITTPMTSASTLVTKSSVFTPTQFPRGQHTITNVIATEPTDLNTREGYSNVDTTLSLKDVHTPGVTQPITTIHYFTPVDEDDLMADDVTAMKKVTLATTITEKPVTSELDFLFPVLETTTSPPKTTKKYYKPTTITLDESNFLEEPTQTTKEFHTSTTVKTKPTKSTSKSDVSTKLTTPSTTQAKSGMEFTTPSNIQAKLTTKFTTLSTTQEKTHREFTTQSNIKDKLSTKFTTRGTTRAKSRAEFTTPSSTQTKSGATETIPKMTARFSPKMETTSQTVKTTTNIQNDEVTNLKPSTEVPLQTVKIKQSNLTGFITSTSATTKINRITTYKPISPSVTQTTKLVTSEATTSDVQQQSTLPATSLQTPITDLEVDYSLMEELSPTESMLTSQKTQPTTIPSTMDSTVPYTSFVTTQKVKERGEKVEITFAPTISTFKTTITDTQTSTTEESSPATIVTQETRSFEEFTTQNETDRTTESTITMTSSSEDQTYSSGTLEPTISTNFNTETISTTTDTILDTNSQPITILTTATTKIKPITTGFLTENGNEKKSTNPRKTDYNEDDIFGAVNTRSEPTTRPTTKKENEESQLARDLFGENNLKAKSDLTNRDTMEGTKIIYSNFYEPSTTFIPQSVKTTETYDTTMNFKHPTSQSYLTSISFKVNRNNESTNSSTDYNSTSNTDRENVEATTEVGGLDAKETFDHLALQVINHAKSIDILNRNTNRTSTRKYKRRRTYVPKNRKESIRRQV